MHSPEIAHLFLYRTLIINLDIYLAVTPTPLTASASLTCGNLCFLYYSFYCPPRRHCRVGSLLGGSLRDSLSILSWMVGWRRDEPGLSAKIIPSVEDLRTRWKQLNNNKGEGVDFFRDPSYSTERSMYISSMFWSISRGISYPGNGFTILLKRNTSGDFSIILVLYWQMISTLSQL